MLELEQLPPIHHFLGGHDLQWDQNTQQLSVKYQALQSFTNPRGTIEGGMICAMLDDVMGLLAWLATERPSTTINLNMEFLRPCEVGVVETQASFIKQGRTILNIDSEAWQDGKLISRCHAAFLRL